VESRSRELNHSDPWGGRWRRPPSKVLRLDFTIAGPFTVTPIPTDHSAFDAYMLLIEGAGKRILYTGDFRCHGRKRSFVDKLTSRAGFPKPESRRHESAQE